MDFTNQEDCFLPPPNPSGDSFGISQISVSSSSAAAAAAASTKENSSCRYRDNSTNSAHSDLSSANGGRSSSGIESLPDEDAKTINYATKLEDSLFDFGTKCATKAPEVRPEQRHKMPVSVSILLICRNSKFPISKKVAIIFAYFAISNLQTIYIRFIYFRKN
jgi:hypothetical protein